MMVTGRRGTVEKVRSEKYNSTVIVKTIPIKEPLTPMVKHFIEDELPRYLRLQNENIAKLLDYKYEKNNIKLFYEYRSGISLKMAIEQTGRFSEEMAALYMKQILSGLQYLHQNNIMHCFLYPTNIFSGEDGEILLLDYGIMIPQFDLDLKKSKQYFKDSSHWMSPEQCIGLSYTSVQDIWSIGNLLVYMLEGDAPFSKMGAARSVFHIASHTAPTLPINISQRTQKFLLACFNRQEDERLSVSQLLNHEFITYHTNLLSDERLMEEIKHHRTVKERASKRKLASSYGNSVSSSSLLRTSAEKRRKKNENDGLGSLPLFNHKPNARIKFSKFTNSISVDSLPSCFAKPRRTSYRSKKICSSAKIDDGIKLFSQFQNRLDDLDDWIDETRKLLKFDSDLSTHLFAWCGFDFILEYIETSKTESINKKLLQLLYELLDRNQDIQTAFCNAGGITSLLNIWRNSSLDIKVLIEKLLLSFILAPDRYNTNVLIANNAPKLFLRYQREDTQRIPFCIKFLTSISISMSDNRSFYKVIENSKLLEDLINMVIKSEDHENKTLAFDLLLSYLSLNIPLQAKFSLSNFSNICLCQFPEAIEKTNSFQVLMRTICDINLEEICSKNDCVCELSFVNSWMVVTRVLCAAPEFRSSLASYGIIQKLILILSFKEKSPIVDHSGLSFLKDIKLHAIHSLLSLIMLSSSRQEASVEFDIIPVLFQLKNEFQESTSSLRMVLKVINSLLLSPTPWVRERLFKENIHFLIPEFVDSKKSCYAMNGLMLWMDMEKDKMKIHFEDNDISNKLISLLKVSKKPIHLERSWNCFFRISLYPEVKDKIKKMLEENTSTIQDQYTGKRITLFAKRRIKEIFKNYEIKDKIINF